MEGRLHSNSLLAFSVDFVSLWQILATLLGLWSSHCSWAALEARLLPSRGPRSWSTVVAVSFKVLPSHTGIWRSKSKLRRREAATQWWVGSYSSDILQGRYDPSSSPNTRSNAWPVLSIDNAPICYYRSLVQPQLPCFSPISYNLSVFFIRPIGIFFSFIRDRSCCSISGCNVHCLPWRFEGLDHKSVHTLMLWPGLRAYTFCSESISSCFHEPWFEWSFCPSLHTLSRPPVETPLYNGLHETFVFVWRFEAAITLDKAFPTRYCTKNICFPSIGSLISETHI